jgi:large subunit ribosomal protein L24
MIMRIKSSLPKKQRQALYQAPLHVKRERLHSHLSKELKKSLGQRALGVRTNDTVKVVRGKFKGKTGKVNKVEYIRGRLYVEGLNRKKSDGTEIQVPFDSSNLVLIDLDRSDNRRLKGKTLPKKPAKEAKPKTEAKKEEKKEEKPVKKEEKKEETVKAEEKKG